MSEAIYAENCQTLKLLLDQAKQECARLKGQLVYGFYEGEFPVYTNGVDASGELSSPITVEEANGLIEQIRTLTIRLAELDELRVALGMFVKQYEGNGHDERENRPEMKKARAVLKRSSNDKH